MIFANLRAQRWNTSFYNVTGSRMEELGRQFKAGEINANQLKEAARDLIKGYGKDIGIDYEVVYLDEKTMPKDSKGSTGSSYILDKKNKKVLIPIDVNKIGDINKLFGTLTEEVSHGKDALEGRQDKKVAEDKSNDEEGLESLGRPANDYVKNKLGEDNNSKIKLSTDGIDLTNADVGEKVGDHLPMNDIKAAGGVEKVLRTETEEEIVKRVGNKSLQKFFDEFYQGATNEKLWSGIYDFTPGLGEGKGFIEGLTGKDMITGEKLNMFQRIIGGIPLIHQAGKGLTLINKPIKSGADFIVNHFISDASKGISKLDNINDTTKLANVAEGIGDSSDITKSVVKEIKIADDSADVAKASKNVEKVGDVSKDITKAVVKEIKIADDSADVAKASKNVEKVGDVSKSITDKVEIPKIKPVENIVGTKTGNKELNNAINTRGTEYYLDLRAQKATAPIDFDNHIINGEINASGKAVGGHSTAGINNNVKIDRLHSVSSNGVRTADISVFDQNTNQWIPKVKRDGITPQETTLFPESWTESRIKVEVDIAYKNRIISQTRRNIWEGTTPSGIKVEGYIAPNTTVYPLP